ncbi:MAG: CHAT domain-containing protein [Dolichospermum sp. DET73]|nr:CHAT domain-containing protein [Dolichospermum sp. DET73]
MLFQVSQVLAQTPVDRKAEADKLFQQGIEQYKISQFTAALQSWQQALIIYREIKDRNRESGILFMLGISYTQQSNFSTAIDYFQQALSIEQKLPKRVNEYQILRVLGDCYQKSGNYLKAIEYYQPALILAKAKKDYKNVKQLLGNLAFNYMSLKNYAAAIDISNQGLALTTNIKDTSGQIDFLKKLADAYHSQGNYQKEIDYLQQILLLAREKKTSEKEEIFALVKLGLAYEGLKNWSLVINYYQQTLVLTRKIKNPNLDILLLSRLGEVYMELKDWKQAIKYYQEYLLLAPEIKDQKTKVSVLGNLGIAYQAQENYAEAIQYYQQALEMARNIKDQDGEATSLLSMGNAFYLLADYQTALKSTIESLKIARSIIDRKTEMSALNTLGNIYYQLNNYDKAIDYYQQKLAIARSQKDSHAEGSVLGNIGLSYTSKGDAAQAINYLEKDLEIQNKFNDPLSQSQTLGYLGTAYRILGNYGKSIEYYQQGLVFARKVKYTRGEAITLSNLGLALFKFGKLPEAEKDLYAAIEILESLRAKLGKNDAYKISIFEEQARTYLLLQQVLIAQNKTNEALEISERGRARAFVELLTSRLSNANTSQTSPPAVDKPTISLLQKIAKQQNATLVQYSIIGDEFKVDGKRKKEESEIYIWVIKPTGEIAFRKSDLKPLWQKENTTLAELVTTSRKSIGVRGRGTRNIIASEDPNAPKAKPRFQRLHELLITPIADLLPKKDTERVVFIPQNQLFLVPFPALQDEKGKYLIEKHTILTAPSIQILDLTHKQKLRQTTKSQPSLIVGNPTMPKVILEPGQPAQQLKALIWAEKEAKDIASLMNISALTGNKATKTAILEKMSQAGIIHFATHGLLDEYRGIGSAIAFAPSGKDDGLLTADEILNLKLNADLVVLSACDTGRGRITGDGVVGLSRSLISAGTASIIVSLWAVDDDSTSFLMTEFYKNREQKLDKATALRKAMLTTKAKYSSPLNWAAFTLIGESE